MRQRKYTVVINWTHKKWGPQTEKLAGEGSSIRRGINGALRDFFGNKQQQRHRRDAHAHVRIEAWRRQP